MHSYLRTSTMVAALLPALVPATSNAAPVHTHAGAARITGSVAADCTLSTLPSFSFTLGIGYVHAPGNAVVAQSALSVRCSKHASVLIGMNTGLYGNAAGAKYGSRSMKSVYGSYLGYDLCHDSACAQVWTPSGITYVSSSDSGASFPVWARILTGQSQAKQDAYSDSVTVTVSF